MTARTTLVSILLASTISCSRSAGESKTREPTGEPTQKAEAGDAGGVEAQHKDEEEHDEIPSRIRIEPDVLKASGVKVAAVVLDALPSTVNLTGELIADPDRSAKIAARVAGRIVDVKFREGERVKEGALLAVLESPELARARATFASARAKAKTARLNAERLERLAGKGLAASQEVATAKSEADALEAETQAARQTLSSFGPSALADIVEAARLQIRAPISGFILQRDAVRGQTVTADHIIASIADLNRIYFNARLFEKDLGRVALGAAADVRLNAYPNEVFTGHIDLLGRQLDSTTRTVTARIALQNRNDLLKVGLFGTALIVVNDPTPREKRPVVPLSAVTKLVDKDVVFVRQPDGHFEVHPVSLGRSAAGRIEIISGLRAGEQVVVEGVFTLKSAVLKSTFGEED